MVANGHSKDLVTDENIVVAYNCNFSGQNIDKAVVLLQAFIDAANGKIDSIVQHMTIAKTGVEEPVLFRLQGADNRNGVTCYLDSLLFCLFARQNDFEPLLARQYPAHPELDTLTTLLRMYVNLMRQGKHITTDITKVLIASIINAGWEPSAATAQQDTCDLFNFITDVLSMPMLTLKLEIAHEGLDSKEDDHKFVNERMLSIAIPGSSNDPPITLEECMENYFQNSVQVFRQLARRKTLDNSSSAADITGRKRQFSIRVSSRELSENELAADYEDHDVPLAVQAFRHRMNRQSRSNTLEDSVSIHSQASSGIVASSNTFKGLLEYDISLKDLSKHNPSAHEDSAIMDPTDTGSVLSMSEELPFPSIKTEPKDSDGDQLPSYHSIYNTSNPAPTAPLEKPALSTLPPNNLWTPNKEFSLPAWMFLQIVPFYTNPKNTQPSSDPLEIEEATESFVGARPVVAMALKRSTWDAAGASVLNNRKVMVPPVIHFPSFVADGNGSYDHTGTAEKYVLVLEAAVFHRGASTISGHFVAVVREKTNIRYADQVQKEAEEMGSTVSVSATRTALSLANSYSFKTLARQTDKDEEDPAPPYSVDNRQDAAGGVVQDVSKSSTCARERWLFFDDMLPADKQVTEVKFEDVFEKETPYLLFYRLVTADDYVREQGSFSSISYSDAGSAPVSVVSSKVDVSNSATGALVMMNDPHLLPVEAASASPAKALKPLSAQHSGIRLVSSDSSSTIPALSATESSIVAEPVSQQSSNAARSMDEPVGIVTVRNVGTFDDDYDDEDDDENQANGVILSQSVTDQHRALENDAVAGASTKSARFLVLPTANDKLSQNTSLSDDAASAGEDLSTEKKSATKLKRSKSRNRYSAWASSFKKSMSRDPSPTRNGDGVGDADKKDKKKKRDKKREKKEAETASEKRERSKSPPKSFRRSLEVSFGFGNNGSSNAVSEPSKEWEDQGSSTLRESMDSVRPNVATLPTIVLNPEIPDLQLQTEQSEIPNAKSERPEQEKKSKSSMPFRRSKGKTSSGSHITGKLEEKHQQHQHGFHHRQTRASLSPEEAKAQQYRAENCVLM